MEKKRYEIEVAGVQLAIISDENEEFVLRTVENLDKEIREITAATKRSSNLDAAILCALAYYSDKVKAEKRARNLEAQISLYDANLRRFREENIALREKLDAFEGGEAPAAEEVEAVAEAPAEEAPAAAAPAAEENAAPAKEDPRAARLRAIDELLGRGKK